jgi:hypothetical protein
MGTLSHRNSASVSGGRMEIFAAPARQRSFQSQITASPISDPVSAVEISSHIQSQILSRMELAILAQANAPAMSILRYCQDSV